MPDQAFYTIGHSNLSSEVFIAALQLHAVRLVMDIRSTPFSRFHPQFNKAALTRSLESAGIIYLFEGQDMGGRPADPSCYIGDVLPNGKEELHRQIDVRRVMARSWYQEGIQRLTLQGNEKRVALLCAEEDPAHCHRQHLVAQSLLSLGYTVLHIRRGGGLQPAWLDPVQLI